MICEIDASAPLNSEFFTLGLWGKPVFWYPFHAAAESGAFEQVVINSDDAYLRTLARTYFGSDVRFGRIEAGAVIDGRAALLMPEGVCSAVETGRSKSGRWDLMDCVTDAEQRVLVDSALGFELSLSILHKRDRAGWLRRDVLQRISEKQELLSDPPPSDSICLIGHSQVDQWPIESICGYKVRNCGISGITAKEYNEDIIGKGLLFLRADAFLVLIGINELVLPVSLRQVSADINTLISMLRRAGNAPIFFVEPLLTNGRLDRRNEQVLRLREELLASPLADDVIWIDTGAMNDGFGHIEMDYTTDGLHLNGRGYDVLTELVETAVRAWKRGSK